ALLTKFGVSPREVQWVPVGTDVNGRAAALKSNRVDATMLTAPVYFRLEQEGFKSLANTSDYDDIFAPTVFLFKKTTVASNPKQVESTIKALAEAIKRFYEDRAFAVQAYLKYNNENQSDVERVYEIYSKANTYERVPYISREAVQYMIGHPP